METILVVDDDPIQRNHTVHDLTLAPYLVLEASGAVEAAQIAISFRERIHLLILGHGGTLRSRVDIVSDVTLLRCRIPILVISSSFEEEIALRLLLSNMDFAFLRKPFSPDALIQAVRQTIRESPTQCASGDR